MSFISLFRNKRVNFFFLTLFSVFDTMKNVFFYRHEVLPYAIKVLQAAGYDLVTVAECLGENPYLRVEDPSVRDVCLRLSFFFSQFFFLTCVYMFYFCRILGIVECFVSH